MYTELDKPRWQVCMLACPNLTIKIEQDLKRSSLTGKSYVKNTIYKYCFEQSLPKKGVWDLDKALIKYAPIRLSN